MYAPLPTPTTAQPCASTPAKTNYNIFLPQKEHARSVICACVLVPEAEGGGYINVFVVHLEHLSEKIRLLQTQEMLTVIDNWKQQQQQQLRVIGDVMLGDFNAVSRSDYSKLEWQSLMNFRQTRGWLEKPLQTPEFVTPDVSLMTSESETTMETEGTLLTTIKTTAEPQVAVIPLLEANGWLDMWLYVNKNSSVDSSGSRSFGFTAWSEQPLMRIDYIWCSTVFAEKWNVEKCEVCTQFPKGSDHFPVVMYCCYKPEK